jgi:hypothetical protein
VFLESWRKKVMPGVPAPAEERFWRFVKKTDDGCWFWVGGKDRKGYGRFRAENKKFWSAHRWAYQYFVGSIPEGMQTDHLCRTPSCVNPAHMEIVTNDENQRRANLLVTTCKYGHQLDGVKKRQRYCKTCAREYNHRRKSNGDL